MEKEQVAVTVSAQKCTGALQLCSPHLCCRLNTWRFVFCPSMQLLSLLSFLSVSGVGDSLQSRHHTVLCSYTLLKPLDLKYLKVCIFWWSILFSLHKALWSFFLTVWFCHNTMHHKYPLQGYAVLIVCRNGLLRYGNMLWQIFALMHVIKTFFSFTLNHKIRNVHFNIHVPVLVYSLYFRLLIQ